MPPRQHIFTGSKYEELAGYARAVIVGDHVYVSGTVGVDFDTGVMPDGATAQAEQALKTIAWSLNEAGSSFDEVVRVRVYIPDPADIMAVSTVLKNQIGHASPANTTVCAPLAVPECKVEIEVEAVRGSALQAD